MSRILLAGAAAFVLGVALVAPPMGATPDAARSATRPLERRVYEVKAGESLWIIARATIGDGTLWPALYHANRDQIKDPTRVYPGQRLAIPTVDPERREALRREADALK
ncbi:MAG: LysM peptidoglycan-binding domain-containing protein [Myxococcota bacterium]|nr:LysM peptidoglycan-binding domain-containing protein [Myxococcota bacterium]